MTDKELKDLVASLAVSQKETNKQIESLFTSQENRDKQIESLLTSQENRDKQIESLFSAQAEVWQQIKQVNKQIGELGNKWETFTEGMAIASIQKILFEKFNIPVVSQNVVKRMNGETIEIDAFGYENSTVNTAVIVEIKSHVREEAVEQIEQTMKVFPKFFPDHANKKLYGVIACVHAPESIKNLLRKKGIFLAVLHDDIFELYPFQNFTPKDFNLA
ncbi:MAG: hypothetical protein JNL70_09600 [Saprospiraceae bacterium]|nr:hypothetical protein [Saprospiraceae bacterium]